MNFWTHALKKPDADIAVLVITANDERTLAAWNGDEWLTHESEMPLSGDVTHWATLEDLPSSQDLAAEERGRSDERMRLEDQVSALENYDPCEECAALPYRVQCHCSSCKEFFAEAALVKLSAGKWLCPKCAADELNKQ